MILQVIQWANVDTHDAFFRRASLAAGASFCMEDAYRQTTWCHELPPFRGLSWAIIWTFSCADLAIGVLKDLGEAS